MKQWRERLKQPFLAINKYLIRSTSIFSAFFDKRLARILMAGLYLFGLVVFLPLNQIGTNKASAGSVLTLNSSTNSSSTSPGVTSLAINKPSGVQAGDVMIAVIGMNNSTQTITPPGGSFPWTSIDSHNYSGGGGKVQAFYRAAGGSEPSSYTWTVVSTAPLAGGITNYRGVDTTNPVEVVGGKAAGNSATQTTGTLTTTTNLAKVIGVFGIGLNIGGTTTSFTASSGTERFDVCSSGLVNNTAVALTDFVQTIAGITTASGATTTGPAPWAAFQIALKPDGVTRMLLFWDSASAPPSGWTEITDFNGLYPRGIDIGNYGRTGGTTTNHVPTASVSIGAASGVVLNRGSNAPAVSLSAHTHTLSGSFSASAASIEPTFRTLRLIRYDAGIPNIIPTNGVAIFDDTPGIPASGWTRLTGQDGYMVKVSTTAGTTGGSDTHTHTLTWPALGAASGTDTRNSFFANQPTAAAAHTHSAPANTTTTPVSNEPPYIRTLLAKADADTPTISLGFSAMFDGDPGGGWVLRSASSGPAEETVFYEKFLQGDTAYNATPLGALTHTHADHNAVTGGAASSSDTLNLFGLDLAQSGHTHTLTASFNNGPYSNVPPYFDVIIAEKVNFTLENYFWYIDNDTLTPTDIWGNPNITVSTPIVTLPVASADPPDLERELRLRIQILIGGNNLAAGAVKFKLQFNKTNSASCITSSGTWADVGDAGGSEEWTYATSAPSDGAILPSSLFSPSSTVLEQYIKSNNPPSFNPNGAVIGNTIEYDFHILHKAAEGAAQYSFRVIETNGTLLSFYRVCPTLSTKPQTANQLRHGNFFEAESEKGFSWVD